MLFFLYFSSTNDRFGRLLTKVTFVVSLSLLHQKAYTIVTTAFYIFKTVQKSGIITCAIVDNNSINVTVSMSISTGSVVLGIGYTSLIKYA